VHQRVEVEGCVESIGERVQKLNLMHGIDANIRGLWVRCLVCAGPVVTLEGVRVRRGGWNFRCVGGTAATLPGSLSRRFIGRRHEKSRWYYLQRG
jgi:hypothetical protein